MRALWAFDPFDSKPKQTAEFYRTLEQIAGSKDAIETGFIVTHRENELNLAFDIPKDERHTIYPRKLIKTAQKNAGISMKDSKIHVLNCPTYSTTTAVDRLLRLARDRHATILALFTQARKGFKRFVIGSFAETAIHRSTSNLLLASPRARFSPRIKIVLFSSDFSEASMEHLRSVLALCRRLKAKLIVYHAAEITYHWYDDDKHPAVKAYKQEIETKVASIRSRCERVGVACDVRLTADFAMVSDTVLKLAKKEKADLIVVAAKARPTIALIGGSVTRQIVRESSKPVLVLKDATPRPRG